MTGKPTYKDLERRILDLEREKADLLEVQERLKETESSFSQLFESAPVPMAYASEFDGYRGTTWNAAWYLAFGYSKEEAQGRSGDDIGLWISVEDRDRMVAMANRQNYVTNFETLLRRKDNTVRTCSLFGRFIEKTSGRLLMLIYFDVTEQKKAEKELRTLRNALTDIIDSMPSVLVGVDAEGRVTQWNKTAEQRTGTCAQAAHGKLLSEVFPLMGPHMALIAESNRSKKVMQRQKIAVTRDGSTCYEDLIIYPLTGTGLEGAVIRLDDVSEKVRMEKMMMQSEKMLSLGGLAAGMAHEVNNPLAGMIQTAHLVFLRLGGGDDIPANAEAAKASGTTMEAIRAYMEARGILSMLETIRKSGKRVADIVENMLNFARKTSPSVSSHNIGELLDKTLDLAATDYDLKRHYDFKSIEILKDYDDALVPCHGVRVQQVFLNILRNGAQAMQEKMASVEGYRPCFTLRVARERAQKMVRVELKTTGRVWKKRCASGYLSPFLQPSRWGSVRALACPSPISSLRKPTAVRWAWSPSPVPEPDLSSGFPWC